MKKLGERDIFPGLGSRLLHYSLMELINKVPYDVVGKTTNSCKWFNPQIKFQRLCATILVIKSVQYINENYRLFRDFERSSVLRLRELRNMQRAGMHLVLFSWLLLMQFAQNMLKSLLRVIGCKLGLAFNWKYYIITIVYCFYFV